ncbi:hypothetical protein [Veillonella sp.]|uniref:hypothetical protein n=1 Tax=Veillonella sp. TaxID=1926307 RepID=UPI0025798EE3|nr:hypothetical protein [Veillonella sp.]MBS6226820.1 S-layer homology domain-containing protein [Veillonella sp.]
MKKQFAAIFAATAVLGVTTAFAANPFSDVTPDSWAYQAVSQLAAAGIVKAKAMANQDRANAEQQAMINRLADEFSNELNNLGVRVARLEDRVGNVKVTGDMRIKWEDQEHASSDTNGRARIQFNAKVNDRTEAVARIKGAYTFGDANGSTGVSLDRAYVNHKFGERVSVKAGRYNQTFGSGLAYDSTFDGAQFNAGNDKVAFQAAYGYLTSANLKTPNAAGTAATTVDKDANAEVVYLGLNGKVGKHADVGGFYARFNDSKALGVAADDGGSAKYNVYKNVYGFNANTNFDKVWVGGEWVKASNVKDSTAWTAGIGFGDYSIAKKGSWDVKGQYFNAKENAPVFDSTWNHKYIQNAKGWMASVDYALQPNVGLSAYYGFDWKTADSAKTDKADFYRAELNYKF